jgi:hypothetical protein
MAVLFTASEKKVAMFDSVTGVAFGPVFDDESHAESFLRHVEEVYGGDIRRLDLQQLRVAVREWEDRLLTFEQAEAMGLDGTARGFLSDRDGAYLRPLVPAR